MNYHEPVMKKECIEALNIRENGIYVDVTFGGGGHSKAILEQLGQEGKLFGFDQDPDAQRNIPTHDAFTFVESNFRYLKRYLRFHGITEVDGILADLGVSSHQFDEAKRGFSFRFEAELDMRMNTHAKLSAKEVINTYSEEDLLYIFSKYGEVRNARSLVRAIMQERQFRNIVTIQDLVNAIEPVIRGKRNKYLAQVFQAIRIEVNDEIKALEDFLQDALKVLKPKGRLVIMSYHSLEDRPVKNFLKFGNFEGTQVKDFYGNIERPFKLITRKAVEASAAEIERNPRARSAKLRVAERH